MKRKLPPSCLPQHAGGFLAQDCSAEECRKCAVLHCGFLYLLPEKLFCIHCRLFFIVS